MHLALDDVHCHLVDGKSQSGIVFYHICATAPRV
jgi:hypothetical protein